MLDSKLINSLHHCVYQAGKEILSIYQQPDTYNIQHKADNSPLTQADTLAHHTLLQGLTQLTPNIPILSEEGELPSGREKWQRYWLIDPLDGTKEFIQHNDEFTVNVALIEHGEPILGAVYAPALNLYYFAQKSQGAYKQIALAQWQPIHTRSLTLPASPGHPLLVVASRRHGVAELERMLEKLQRAIGPYETVNMGSSLKICLVAEGKADIYPRLAPTCEWDTAAAQIILQEAGGALVGPDFNLLKYNQKDSIKNPNFYALGDKNFAWKEILK